MQTNIENPSAFLPENLSAFIEDLLQQPEKEIDFWRDLTTQTFAKEEELRLLDFIERQLQASKVFSMGLGCMMDWGKHEPQLLNSIAQLHDATQVFNNYIACIAAWILNENNKKINGIVYWHLDITEAAFLYKKFIPNSLAAQNLGLLLANNPVLAEHFTNKDLGDIANVLLKNKKQEIAKSLFEIAVDRGCPKAMNNLGYMYQQGNGIPIDYEKALSYYETAAQIFKEPTSINNLGAMLYLGQGSPKNLEKAVLYFREAFNLDCKEAKVSLGKMKERHPDNFFVQYHCAMALDCWKELQALHESDSKQLEKCISEDDYLEKSEKDCIIMSLQNIENAVFYFRQLSLDDKEARLALSKMKDRNPDNFFVQYHCAIALNLGSDLARLHEKDPEKLLEYLSSDWFLEEDAKTMLYNQFEEAQSAFHQSVESCLGNNKLSFFPQYCDEEQWQSEFGQASNDFG